jgi:hypothetical protein
VHEFDKPVRPVSGFAGFPALPISRKGILEKFDTQSIASFFKHC